MPGVRCSVYGCPNGSDRTKSNDVIYHIFPKDLAISNAWLARCNREKLHASSRICSNHFLESDYARDLKAELLNLVRRKNLRVDAVPSLELPLEVFSCYTSIDSGENLMSTIDNSISNDFIECYVLNICANNDCDNQKSQTNSKPIVYTSSDSIPIITRAKETNIDLPLSSMHEAKSPIELNIKLDPDDCDINLIPDPDNCDINLKPDPDNCDINLKPDPGNSYINLKPTIDTSVSNDFIKCDILNNSADNDCDNEKSQTNSSDILFLSPNNSLNTSSINLTETNTLTNCYDVSETHISEKNNRFTNDKESILIQNYYVHLLENQDKELLEYKKKIDDCMKELVDCQRKLFNREKTLIDRTKQFFNCEKTLNNCNRKLLNCEKTLNNRTKKLFNCEKKLKDRTKKLFICKKTLIDRNKELVMYKKSLGNLKKRFRKCEAHIFYNKL